MTKEQRRRRVLIVGAAGRDFHNFNVAYREDDRFAVVAFTAAQIPGIDERTYPSELAGHLYPDGIPIYPEDELERLVRDLAVDEVVFSYSDVSHETVMHVGSRALAAGSDYTLLGPRSTMLTSSSPIIAVCAVRTGSGKSQTTRAVTKALKAAGQRIAVVRHPMPYGDLVKQRVQRFETYEDMDAADCTIEEREEYEPHVAAGSIVYAGIDYEQILRAAEKESDVVVWDGGNNDLPFYSPDVHITVADPLRAGHETRYHPGEANLRMADVIVINKVDSAAAEDLDALRGTISSLNADAETIEATSPISIQAGIELKGARVIVVEDGPTLTHGEMAYGAGVVAARQAGAEPIDPRPWAVGSIKEIFERFGHIGPLLPAMGYSDRQRDELAQTINAADVDAVLVATPIDLRKIIAFEKPAARVAYELDDSATEALAQTLRKRLDL